jgi:hypothetical protein
MVLLPGAREQRLIGGLPDQGMLELIGGLGWHAPLIDQFRFDELA